jgi:hypothetical protein
MYLAIHECAFCGAAIAPKLAIPGDCVMCETATVRRATFKLQTALVVGQSV